MTDMTKDEIIERLIELDVDHNPRDNKAVLEELLEAQDGVSLTAPKDEAPAAEKTPETNDVPADFVLVTVTKAGDGKIFTGKQPPEPRHYERREQFWCSPETAKQLEARHYAEIED